MDETAYKGVNSTKVGKSRRMRKHLINIIRKYPKERKQAHEFQYCIYLERLDKILSRFFLDVRSQDGNFYETSGRVWNYESLQGDIFAIYGLQCV